MGSESTKDFYDKQYSGFMEQRSGCITAVHDVQKASRRVNGAIQAFGLQDCVAGKRVLDVGSGLGYYTNALALAGAQVTGLDFSKAGVDVARATFPKCDFRQGAWPDDVERKPEFDLIWAVNFSLINTFDVQAINKCLVVEAMARLKPNGCLLVGWNTDLSGRSVNGYSHWSLATLREMRKVCGLSAPRIAEAKNGLVSWAMIRAGLVLKKSVPLFMIRRKSG